MNGAVRWLDPESGTWRRRSFEGQGDEPPDAPPNAGKNPPDSAAFLTRFAAPRAPHTRGRIAPNCAGKKNFLALTPFSRESSANPAAGPGRASKDLCHTNM